MHFLILQYISERLFKVLNVSFIILIMYFVLLGFKLRGHDWIYKKFRITGLGLLFKGAGWCSPFETEHGYLWVNFIYVKVDSTLWHKTKKCLMVRYSNYTGFSLFRICVICRSWSNCQNLTFFNPPYFYFSGNMRSCFFFSRSCLIHAAFWCLIVQYIWSCLCVSNSILQCGHIFLSGYSLPSVEILLFFLQLSFLPDGFFLLPVGFLLPSD